MKSFDYNKFWNSPSVRMSTIEELSSEFEKMLESGDCFKFPLDKNVDWNISEKTVKDGDSISEHKDHEIVTSSAARESFRYCRDCKVEVKAELPSLQDLLDSDGITIKLTEIVE